MGNMKGPTGRTGGGAPVQRIGRINHAKGRWIQITREPGVEDSRFLRFSAGQELPLADCHRVFSSIGDPEEPGGESRLTTQRLAVPFTPTARRPTFRSPPPQADQGAQVQGRTCHGTDVARWCERAAEALRNGPRG